jgi:hypothetical protein
LKQTPCEKGPVEVYWLANLPDRCHPFDLFIVEGSPVIKSLSKE